MAAPNPSCTTAKTSVPAPKRRRDVLLCQPSRNKSVLDAETAPGTLFHPQTATVASCSAAPAETPGAALNANYHKIRRPWATRNVRPGAGAGHPPYYCTDFRSPRFRASRVIVDRLIPVMFATSV